MIQVNLGNTGKLFLCNKHASLQIVLWIVFHLIFDTSDCIVGSPVNGIRKITGIVGRVVDLGVVSVVDSLVGVINLVVFSISLVGNNMLERKHIIVELNRSPL